MSSPLRQPATWWGFGAISNKKVDETRPNVWKVQSAKRWRFWLALRELVIADMT